MKSSHAKNNYGLILQKLTEDLCILETTGILVVSNGSRKQFFGSVACVIADNLGSHEFVGFRKWFSNGSYADFVMAHYSDLQNI